jgi:hypothetical protein
VAFSIHRPHLPSLHPPVSSSAGPILCTWSKLSSQLGSSGAMQENAQSSCRTFQSRRPEFLIAHIVLSSACLRPQISHFCCLVPLVPISTLPYSEFFSCIPDNHFSLNLSTTWPYCHLSKQSCFLVFSSLSPSNLLLLFLNWDKVYSSTLFLTKVAYSSI